MMCYNKYLTIYTQELFNFKSHDSAQDEDDLEKKRLLRK